MSEAINPKFTARISPGYGECSKPCPHGLIRQRTRSRRKPKAIARPCTRSASALYRAARVGFLALTPAASHFAKPDSRIFQGVSWNVSRPERSWFHGKQRDWSDATNDLLGKLLPRMCPLALAASRHSH